MVIAVGAFCNDARRTDPSATLRYMQIDRRTLLLATLAGAVTGCASGSSTSTPASSPKSTPPAGGTRPLQVDAPTSTVAKPRFNSVAIIGDSITAECDPAIRTALTTLGFTDITIDAEPSRRIEEGRKPINGVDTLTTMLASGVDPQVWVVALGTNNIDPPYTAEAFTPTINTLLTKFPVDQPLVWIDVYFKPRQAGAAVFNQTLTDLLTVRDNAVVGSWSALATAPGADLTRDGVHPKDASRVLFAGVIADALQALQH